MTAVLDDVWTAVGDPNRRRLLDLLLDTGQSTPTKLAGRLPLTRQAVSKHLAVLERAGLVDSTHEGRQMTYRIRAAEFDRAARSLAEVAAQWDRRLRRIKAIAEAIEAESTKAESTKAGAKSAGAKRAGASESTTR